MEFGKTPRAGWPPRCVAWCALACIGVAANGAPASAASVGVHAFGAFNTHLMQFWNSDLELANAAGGRFSRLSQGVSAGGGLHAWLGESCLIELDGESLPLETRDPPTGRGLILDALSVQLAATFMSRTHGNARFGLGGGPGYYRMRGRRVSAGATTARLSGATTARLSGATLGLQLHARVEWSLRGWLALTALAGYRVADIADTKSDGVSTRPQIATDYSGLMARIGLAAGPPARKR